MALPPEIVVAVPHLAPISTLPPLRPSGAAAELNRVPILQRKLIGAAMIVDEHVERGLYVKRCIGLIIARDDDGDDDERTGQWARLMKYRLTTTGGSFCSSFSLA